MKYVSLDLETTGRVAGQHYVTEFGVVIDDLSKPRPVDSLPSLTGYITHGENNEMLWELGALLMFQDRLEEYNKAEKIPVEDVVERILQFIGPFMIPDYAKLVSTPGFDLHDALKKQRITFAGKQFPGFDKKFIEYLPNGYRLIDVMHYRSMDPGSMFVLPTDNEIPSTSECMKRAGIGGSVQHRALDDARNVVRLIRAHHKLPF
jgi:DNA polymerase III epsilon subunit-like protein